MVLTPSTGYPTLRMTLAMILSGSIGILVVGSGQNAITVVFWRCLIGAIAIAVYGALTRRTFVFRRARRTWGLMILTGMTMAANWVFFFMAYRHAPISTVTIVYHLYPFVLIVAAGVFWGERVQKQSLGWAAIAFFGVVVVALGVDGNAGIDLTGIGLTAIAMLFYATTLLLAKRLQDVPAELVSIVQLVIRTLLLLPFQSTLIGNLGVQAWVSLLILGVVHTGVLYVLLYGAVQHLSTNAVALLSFLYPATALAFDILAYDLRPGPMQIVGIILILMAVLAERVGIRKVSKV